MIFDCLILGIAVLSALVVSAFLTFKILVTLSQFLIETGSKKEDRKDDNL